MVKKIETNAYQAKGIAVRTVDFDFVLDKKRFTVLASPNPTYLDGDIGDKLIESCIDAGYKTFIPLEYSAKLVKLKTVKVTGEEMYSRFISNEYSRYAGLRRYRGESTV